MTPKTYTISLTPGEYVPVAGLEKWFDGVAQFVPAKPRRKYSVTVVTVLEDVHEVIEAVVHTEENYRGSGKGQVYHVVVKCRGKRGTATAGIQNSVDPDKLLARLARDFKAGDNIVIRLEGDVQRMEAEAAIGELPAKPEKGGAR